MCDRIIFKDGTEVGSIRQFQEKFNADATLYGWDGDETFLDCCMCELRLDKFFKNHPQYRFEYDCGDWYEL